MHDVQAYRSVPREGNALMRAFMSSRDARPDIRTSGNKWQHRVNGDTAIAEARAILAETEPGGGYFTMPRDHSTHYASARYLAVAYGAATLPGIALADALTTFLSMEIS